MTRPIQMPGFMKHVDTILIGALMLLVISGVLAGALHMAWIRIAPNWAPWSTVELNEPPPMIARVQLNSLAVGDEACLKALDRAGLLYNRVQERPMEDGCGMENVVRIERSNIPYSSVFPGRCALVAALFWYEQELEKLAQDHLQTKVTQVQHFGSYACRNIYGQEEGRRSQHATANALDISGFTLADGREISVLRDWGKETDKGRFLKAAHDKACGLFNTVIGPDYNKAHANHFHVDMGRTRFCR